MRLHCDSAREFWTPQQISEATGVPVEKVLSIVASFGIQPARMIVGNEQYDLRAIRAVRRFQDDGLIFGVAEFPDVKGV